MLCWIIGQHLATKLPSKGYSLAPATHRPLATDLDRPQPTHPPQAGSSFRLGHLGPWLAICWIMLGHVDLPCTGNHWLSATDRHSPPYPPQWQDMALGYFGPIVRATHRPLATNLERPQPTLPTSGRTGFGLFWAHHRGYRPLATNLERSTAHPPASGRI